MSRRHQQRLYKRKSTTARTKITTHTKHTTSSSPSSVNTTLGHRSSRANGISLRATSTGNVVRIDAVHPNPDPERVSASASCRNLSPYPSESARCGRGSGRAHGCTPKTSTFRTSLPDASVLRCETAHALPMGEK